MAARSPSLFVSMFAIFFGFCGFGQVSTSRLAGVIVDPSGRSVPGALVEAANRMTGLRFATSSNDQGLYALLSLPAGEYTVTVEAEGFRKAVLTGLILTVGGTATENIRLDLGPVTEIVTVRAKDTGVDSADPQGKLTVSLQEVENLPQLERYPITLTLFHPGIQIAGGNLINSRVNGMRGGSNVAKLDGIDANDPWAPGLLWSLFSTTDSTQEFRMVTHGAKAEYGRNAGAQIEMVTRSGTNRWSGSASNHLRNTLLNANDYFNNASGLPRGKFIQNIFAASLGGPLLRNRTFIFGNYQGRRLRQEFTRDRDVLTPSARVGVFRWRPPDSSSVEFFDIDRNDPRGLGIDPQIAKQISLLPDPNNFDRGDGLNTGNFRFNSPGELRGDQATMRVDHQLFQRLVTFLRLSGGNGKGTDAFNGNDPTYPGQPQGILQPKLRGYSLGLDWTMSPRMVNELRIGYQRTALARTPTRLPEAMLVTTLWTPPLNPRFGNATDSSVYEITDNLSLLRGTHVIKVGANWHLTRTETRNEMGIYPNVSLSRANGNNPPDSVGPNDSSIQPSDRVLFEELYNHLLGRISQVSQRFHGDLERYQPGGTVRLRDFRFANRSWFIQDDWKLRSYLTLSLGLRYEYHAPPAEHASLAGTLNHAAQLTRASRIADLEVQRTARWYNGDYNNFAPRFGFAWAIGGDRKTVMRAHYGILYERPVSITVTLADNFTPGFSATRVVLPNEAPGSDHRLSDRIPLPQVPAVPSARLPNTRREDIGIFDPNLRTGYVQQYGLGIQSELWRGTVMEVGFFGNRGVKLLLPVNMNQLRIHDDFLTAFREIQAFRAGGPAVSSGNTLVRLFGSVNQATTSLQATFIDQGSAGAAANRLDTTFYSRYAAAGLSDHYLRNFPQYGLVVVGTNEGRSYYDSLQVSLRRQAGAIRVSANYTWSKSIDLVSTNGLFAQRPVDSLNLRLNRARADFDRPHVFTGAFSYTVPAITRWRGVLGSALRGWSLGLLAIWESGSPFSVLSGRNTVTADMESYANYTGDRNIGRVHQRDGGVFWFTPEQIGRFSAPAAGEIGTSGRNGFRGPRWFNTDLSAAKTFRISERQAIIFRSEFYNLFNNANFANPGASLANPATLGRFSATTRTVGVPVGGDSGGPRIVQLALRYEF